MIDFDDLEEEAQGRADRGELDEVAAKAALGGPEPPGPFEGGYLWPIKRNRQFPDYDVLPERLRENVGKSWQARGTRLRLFIFYGAGDSFPFWAQWMTDCPEWVEVAVYEWPSHGSREEEALPPHVDGIVADALEGLAPLARQVARGGPQEGAPFALMGHSIGVLIMLGVAERLKALHGISPCCALVMDRGAPQHPLCSDFGADLLAKDALDFIRIFNPHPYNLYQNSKAQDGERNASSKPWQMCKMWMDDIKLQQNTKPQGFHTFHCPVHVFVAMFNWGMDSEEAMAKMDPATLSWHRERCAILGSAPGSAALWDLDCYKDWSGWTSSGCAFHELDMDHAAMKLDRSFARLLWRLLADFQCPVPEREEL